MTDNEPAKTATPAAPAAPATESPSSGSAPAPRKTRFGRFGSRRKLVEPEEPLDYKNVAYLAKFLSANGRIQSRKRTGFSGQNQRKLATAIKRARIVGLLPFVGRM
ncbi:MAG TPA: 30S ribosomal protein S18 [bacterium]|nr:30S ribosomal protein S18 [bacterium]